MTTPEQFSNKWLNLPILSSVVKEYPELQVHVSEYTKQTKKNLEDITALSLLQDNGNTNGKGNGNNNKDNVYTFEYSDQSGHEIIDESIRNIVSNQKKIYFRLINFIDFYNQKSLRG